MKFNYVKKGAKIFIFTVYYTNNNKKVPVIKFVAINS